MSYRHLSRKRVGMRWMVHPEAVCHLWPVFLLLALSSLNPCSAVKISHNSTQREKSADFEVLPHFFAGWWLAERLRATPIAIYLRPHSCPPLQNLPIISTRHDSSASKTVHLEYKKKKQRLKGISKTVLGIMIQFGWPWQVGPVRCPTGEEDTLYRPSGRLWRMQSHSYHETQHPLGEFIIIQR